MHSQLIEDSYVIEHMFLSAMFVGEVSVQAHVVSPGWLTQFVFLGFVNRYVPVYMYMLYMCVCFVFVTQCWHTKYRHVTYSMT